MFSFFNTCLHWNVLLCALCGCAAQSVLQEHWQGQSEQKVTTWSNTFTDAVFANKTGHANIDRNFKSKAESHLSQPENGITRRESNVGKLGVMPFSNRHTTVLWASTRDRVSNARRLQTRAPCFGTRIPWPIWMFTLGSIMTCIATHCEDLYALFWKEHLFTGAMGTGLTPHGCGQMRATFWLGCDTLMSTSGGMFLIPQNWVSDTYSLVCPRECLASPACPYVAHHTALSTWTGTSDERRKLREVLSALNWSPDHVSDDNVCSWPGVRCASEDCDQVCSPLEASQYSVVKTSQSGTMQTQIGSLSGLRDLYFVVELSREVIPPQFGNASVHRLFYGGNYWPDHSAGTLPPELGRLQTLEVLAMSSSRHMCFKCSPLEPQFNYTMGTVPPSLLSLKHLSMCMFADAYLRGTFPSADKAHGLKLLLINWNGVQATPMMSDELPNLVGPFPPLPLGAHHQNYELVGGDSWFATNSMPSTWGNTTLTGLWLRQIDFHGLLPPETGKLVEHADHFLKGFFRLGSGSVPEELSNTTIRPCCNYFNCASGLNSQIIGLFFLTSCYYTTLEFTLTSSLPALPRRQIHSYIGCISVPSIEGHPHFGLKYNDDSYLFFLLFHSGAPSQSGTLASEAFSKHPSLQQMMLAVTQMYGTVPPELGALTGGLVALQFSILGVHGLFSPAATFPLLQGDFYVDQNSLSGSLPLIGGSVMETQEWTDNVFSGGLPNMSSLVALKSVACGKNLLSKHSSFSRALTSGFAYAHADNRFLSVPYAMTQYRSFGIFESSNNRLEVWPWYGAGPREWLGIINFCMLQYIPLKWVNVLRVSLRNNPVAPVQLGIRMDVGVALPQLEGLDLSKFRVMGGITNAWIGAKIFPNYGENWIEATIYDPFISEDLCKTSMKFGFVKLRNLDLSGNDALAWSLVFLPDKIQSISLKSNKLIGLAKYLLKDGLHHVMTFNDFYGLQKDCPLSGVRSDDVYCFVDACITGRPQFFLDRDSPITDTNIQDNSLARLSVDPPLTPVASPCPTEVGYALIAKHSGWVISQTLEGVECTTLCPGNVYRLAADLETVDHESLCRCTSGHGGKGSQCMGCPSNTHANYTADILKRDFMISECEPCPKNADTAGFVNASVANFGSVCQEGDLACHPACVCQANFYKCNPTATSFDCPDGLACSPCPRYMTSPRESAKQTACRCIHESMKVLSLDNMCGCSDQKFMDQLTQVCKACGQGIRCKWHGAFDDVEKSLSVPLLLTGFWAIWPVDNVSTFGGHIVYRCYSQITCPQLETDGVIHSDNVCELNRGGRACSLCIPRHFGTADGQCTQCAGTMQGMRLRVAVIGIFCIPGFAMFHFFIKVTSEGNTANVQIRALKMSFRQWVKYFQTLSVVSAFHVQWPPLPANFFRSAIINMFSFQQYNGPLAVGCLGEKQTVWLDMAFRWSMAFFIPIASGAAALFSLIVGFILTKIPVMRVQQIGKLFAFRWMGAAKTGYVVTTFLFTGLMQNGFLLMMCRGNPNGIFTVIDYPHLACDITRGEWKDMIPVMVLYLLVVGILFLLFGAWVVKRQTTHLGASQLKSRGPWGLISQDFRATHLYWPLVLQIKDVLLNLIAAIFGLLGDGMLQLVFAGGLNLFYALWVMVELPSVVFTNSINETLMAMSIFSIIFMSAATGLQENPGGSGQTEAFEGNEKLEEQYAMRENLLFAIQLIGVLAPALVVVLQLLLVRPLTARLLPAYCVALSPEKKQIRGAYLQSALTTRLDSIVSRFDDCEFKRFNALMSSSAATVGVFQSDVGSLHPSRRMRNILASNMPPIPGAGDGKSANSARDGAEGATISV